MATGMIKLDDLLFSAIRHNIVFIKSISIEKERLTKGHLCMYKQEMSCDFQLKTYRK